jgi:hypothetical protein
MAQQLPQSLWSIMPMQPQEQFPPVPLAPMDLQQAQQQIGAEMSPELLEEIQAAEAMGAPPRVSGSSSMSMKQKSGFNPSYGEQFDNAFNDSMGLRKEQLDVLKQRLAETQAKAPTGLAAMNLKPFMAFADSLTGQKTAHNYEEPEAVERNRTDVQRLQDAVEKSGNMLSDDQLNYLKLKAQEEMYKLSASKAERAAARSGTMEEDRLRKEYLSHPLYKNMADINKAYTAVENNPGIGGPAQQALVFQFSKILDPGSVVRETEYAQSAANAGKIAQAENFFNRLKSGETLQPEQIALMKDVARNLVESARAQLDVHNDTYTQLSINKGVSPKNVIIDPFYKGKEKKQSAGAPKVGEVVDGFKYVGGDPSKPESWSK